LVRSALRTFASHVEDHQRRGPCPEADAPPVRPLPDARPAQSIMRPQAR
jgi:hypothetical protein